jgi:hypothetical protein
MAFVKVVEGSEIYNFPIYHFEHFYSNFFEKISIKRCQSYTFEPRCCLGARARAAQGRALPGRSFPMSACMPRTPRAPHRCTADRCRPAASPPRRHRPSVRQSLGSTRTTYKGAAALASRAELPATAGPPPPCPPL